MAQFDVKYKVKNSTSNITLSLEGGMESEAIAKLRQQGTVAKDAQVVILSITKR